ncbi:putative zinc finger, CCHC-type containing protein [Tanacetum coccineum]
MDHDDVSLCHRRRLHVLSAILLQGFGVVAKLATVRVLIVIATAKGWPLHQFDVINAFLHGHIDEDICMKPLDGYSKVVPEQGDYLTQRKYIFDLLHDVGLTTVKPVNSPLPPKLKLTLKKGSFMSAPYKYRSPTLESVCSCPKESYMQATVHLLKYLKGTISNGLFYPVQPLLKVTGFSDADWASCLMTRKSLTSYCIFLGHSLVSWKTKKHVTVSMLSTEAKYRSMAATTCELIWLTYLLKDLHILVNVPITMFCDNKDAQQIAANP